MELKAQIKGTCDPRFTKVREVFERNFAKGPEVGASVCVYHQGQPVVDLWGGIADPETGEPWERDTITVLASTSKALAATAALLLVQRGELDLDAPVARYWPEFAAAGKERILVRWLLSHRAGVVAFDRPAVSMEEKRAFTPVAEAIAAARPCWEPGTAHGYHAVTFGFAVSEIIRRVTGLTLGRFFDKEIAKPLGLDLHIGFRGSDTSRIAHLIAPTRAEGFHSIFNLRFFPMYRAIANKSSLAYRATYGAVEARFGDKEAERQYDIEDASANALGNAAGLARMFAALIGEIDGIRLLNTALMNEARQPVSSGLDEVLRIKTDWGLGYMLPGGPMWRDFDARAFGHGGASGSLAFADPENAIAFGYVPNKWAEMRSRMLGTRPRQEGLVNATYRALGNTKR